MADHHAQDASPPIFEGRIGVLQTVLARYRVPLFETIAARCTRGLSLHAGREAAGVDPGGEIASGELSSGAVRHTLGGPLTLHRVEGTRDWLERTDPDAVITEANPRNLSSHAAIEWMHKRGRPALGWGLGTMHVTRQPALVRALHAPLRDRFLRRFDGLIAYSSRAADEYAAVGVPRERVEIAHNACTLRPAGDYPERAPMEGRRPVVLFVGLIAPRKRLDLLIRACARLPEQLRPELRIVGDGDGRAAAEALARDVLPNAAFLGKKFGDELTEIWRSADLFVLPGQGGLAIQEAMSHGLPCIVAEGDGTQFDLVRGPNGWHVTPGDEESLLAALTAALREPHALAAMGRESFRIVQEEINIERMADAMIRAVNAAARRSPNHAPAAAASAK